MKILLAGGTGFIGTTVLEKLLSAEGGSASGGQRGDEVVLLTRSGKTPFIHERLKVLGWDGKNQGDWSTEIETTQAVINLAGESIAAKRWSDPQKKKIIQSRLGATRALVEAIRNSKKKPSVFVNASAVGYYGNVPSGEVSEERGRGEGFLPEVCGRWEAEAGKAGSSGVRVVLLRFGIVIEKGGGALQKLIPPFQFFAGGPLGDGKQYFPWVHRDDAVNIICFALEEKSLAGAVNVVSPDPVTMKEFCSALGQAMHRPSWARVPAFLLKLLLGEMSGMLLEGQKAVPAKLKRAGYSFIHPELHKALGAIFDPPRRRP